MRIQTSTSKFYKEGIIYYTPKIELVLLEHNNTIMQNNDLFDFYKKILLLLAELSLSG